MKLLILIIIIALATFVLLELAITRATKEFIDSTPPIPDRYMRELDY